MWRVLLETTERLNERWEEDIVVYAGVGSGRRARRGCIFLCLRVWAGAGLNEVSAGAAAATDGAELCGRSRLKIIVVHRQDSELFVCWESLLA